MSSSALPDVLLTLQTDKLLGSSLSSACVLNKEGIKVLIMSQERLQKAPSRAKIRLPAFSIYNMCLYPVSETPRKEKSPLITDFSGSTFQEG